MPNLGQPVLTMSGPLIELAGPSRARAVAGGCCPATASRARSASSPAPASPGCGCRARPRPSPPAPATGSPVADRAVGPGPGGRHLPGAAPAAADAHWCAQSEEIYPPGYAEDPPPPLVLADRATFTAVSRRLQEPRLELFWDLELAPGLTLAEARASAAAFPAAGEAMAAPAAA